MIKKLIEDEIQAKAIADAYGVSESILAETERLLPEALAARSSSCSSPTWQGSSKARTAGRWSSGLMSRGINYRRLPRSWCWWKQSSCLWFFEPTTPRQNWKRTAKSNEL